MTEFNCIAKRNWATKACVIFLLRGAMAVALPAQTAPGTSTVPIFTTVHDFDGRHGKMPVAGLVQAADGSLYGTTIGGGSTAAECDPFGCGTVFKLTPDGTLDIVHYFDGTHGSGPGANLIQATDGNFYGTTEGGGANSQGTVFKITPSGVFTTLYNFCALPDCTDGASSRAPLVQGSDGNFYGTTWGDDVMAGSVFKVTPNGVFTTLYNFCSLPNCTDGYEPVAGLIEGSDGNFYGTTYEDGAYEGGTVFRITPSGILTIVYNFCSQISNDVCTDGAGPQAGLSVGADGNFYGTPSSGGAGSNGGTVFKLTPGGTLTTLHDFCSKRIDHKCVDGLYPENSLTLATDGNFYGTTREAGIRGGGTAFRITPRGTFSPLHEFCPDGNLACQGGSTPTVLTQDTSGNFYGTAELGGANGDGTAFSLSVGLGPFVETNPAAGKVGTTVGILGTDLTGATGVKFNGTATVFRLVSSTFIEAKVPSGATTGKVTVQLPGGTLSSNVPFIVLH